ncbi:MAG: helix-turn-helix transcriptional regulator [Gemmatimonadaceae bacterium]
MRKSLFSKEYSAFLNHLKRARVRAGITQQELAVRLSTTQSFVSKCERGERRLDIIELRAWCGALEVSLPAFVTQLDRALVKVPVR